MSRSYQNGIRKISCSSSVCLHDRFGVYCCEFFSAKSELDFGVKTYKTCFQVWVLTGVHTECPNHITTVSSLYLLVSDVFVAFRQVVLRFFLNSIFIWISNKVESLPVDEILLFWHMPISKGRNTFAYYMKKRPFMPWFYLSYKNF